MSHEAAAPRVRLNADVWAHAISFLSNARSLLAFETTSRAHLTITRKSTAWRATLARWSSPHLAAAFLRAAPAAARTLCRAWARRWRATDCSELGDGSDGDPRLCMRSRGGPVLRRPHVVLAVGDECAGVMNWESRLSDGTVDDDRSLVLNIGERDNARLYSPYEMHMGDGAVATSCFVVDPDGTLMIELWRDVTSFNNCTRLGGRPISYYHGGIELSRCRESDDAASVLSYIVENGRPEGTEILTPTCYIHYCRLDFANSPVGPLYQIVDATLSLTIRMRDTLFGFDDMALMLTMALRHHPDANEDHDHSRAVFALPIGEL